MTAQQGRVDDAAVERRFRLGLAALTVAAGVLRLVYLFVSKVNDTSLVKQGDAFWYSSTAWKLADGGLFRNFFTGVPTADHPPLTVVVLAPISVFTGVDPMPQRIVMVVLGALTVTVVGLAGRALGGRRVGLLAAAVALVMPALWINDVLLMSETPAALLIAATIWACIVLVRRPSTRLALGAGALCGLATLARAELGLFLPLMVWPVIWVAGDLDRRRKAVLSAGAAAVMLAVLAPWILLNLSRFEKPVLVSTNDGVTLAGANCDATYRGELKGAWAITPCVIDAYARIEAAKPPAAPDAPPFRCADSFQQRPPCLDASEISAKLRRDGLSYARHHASDLPGVVLARNGRVWGVYRLDQSLDEGSKEARPRLATALAFGLTWVLVPVYVVGLVLLRRRRVSLIPLLAPLAVALITTSVFTAVSPRYRLPWDVAACLVAAVVLDDLLGRRARKVPQSAPTHAPAGGVGALGESA